MRQMMISGCNTLGSLMDIAPFLVRERAWWALDDFDPLHFAKRLTAARPTASMNRVKLIKARLTVAGEHPFPIE
jgi:hypothetical protein